MKEKHNWKDIRARYEAGENCAVISRIHDGKPTRHGIRKRAIREGWLSISPDTKQAVRHLPSLQNPSLQRATSNELGERTERNARLILTAFERGVSPKIAAGLVGLTLDQFKQWINDDHQFAMEVMLRSAQAAGEHVQGIGAKDDWRAGKWLLEHGPFSREEYGSQRAEKEAPTIVLNIHRDEVVIESPVQRTEIAQPVLKSIDRPDKPQLSSESESEPVNWQGVTVEEKLESGQKAVDQRVMGRGKY